MTTYRFIGTGVTDASGVARLTKDPNGQTINGYTGTGNGEIDFIASLDNPIVDGSIQSETYATLDCLFYDEGISSATHNPNWTVRDMSFDYSQGYTILSETGATFSRITSPLIEASDLIIEFDYHRQGSNAHYMMILDNGGSSRFTFNMHYYLSSDCHFKLEIHGLTGTPYVDGVKKPDITLTGADNGKHNWVFQINNNGESIGFSNLKIYPI